MRRSSPENFFLDDTSPVSKPVHEVDIEDHENFALEKIFETLDDKQVVAKLIEMHLKAGQSPRMADLDQSDDTLLGGHHADVLAYHVEQMYEFNVDNMAQKTKIRTRSLPPRCDVVIDQFFDPFFFDSPCARSHCGRLEERRKSVSSESSPSSCSEERVEEPVRSALLESSPSSMSPKERVSRIKQRQRDRLPPIRRMPKPVALDRRVPAPCEPKALETLKKLKYSEIVRAGLTTLPGSPQKFAGVRRPPGRHAAASSTAAHPTVDPATAPALSAQNAFVPSVAVVSEAEKGAVADHQTVLAASKAEDSLQDVSLPSEAEASAAAVSVPSKADASPRAAPAPSKYVAAVLSTSKYVANPPAVAAPRSSPRDPLVTPSGPAKIDVLNRPSTPVKTPVTEKKPVKKIASDEWQEVKPRAMQKGKAEESIPREKVEEPLKTDVVNAFGALADVKANRRKAQKKRKAAAEDTTTASVLSSNPPKLNGSKKQLVPATEDIPSQVSKGKTVTVEVAAPASKGKTATAEVAAAVKGKKKSQAAESKQGSPVLEQNDAAMQSPRPAKSELNGTAVAKKAPSAKKAPKAQTEVPASSSEDKGSALRNRNQQGKSQKAESTSRSNGRQKSRRVTGIQLLDEQISTLKVAIREYSTPGHEPTVSPWPIVVFFLMIVAVLMSISKVLF